MTDLKKLRELAVAICKTDFESEDFNDTLLIDHVVAKGGTMRIAFEMTKPLRDFIAAANPQAIIEILDRLELLENCIKKEIHRCGDWKEGREALEGGK